MSVGCSSHTAAIIDRNGATVCALDQMLEVSWERTLDEVSPAFVTAGAGGDCCECLGDVRPWAHTLVIWRGGELVWSGPVARIEWGHQSTTIFAFDILAWLARRTFDVDLGFVGMDLATVAAAVIEHGMSQDDPGHSVETVELTGVVDDRQYTANDGTVLDALRDLARAGLDFTAVGNTIVLIDEDGTCPVVGTLGDDDFPDGLTVVEDGLSLCTEAVVVGDGVVGRAGGTSPFYGLLTCVTEDDKLLTVGAANAAAVSQVAGSSPAPVWVMVPDDSRLAPNADVNVEQLVPGWCVTVSTSRTCRDLVATLRILSVRVGETPAEGERIGLTFTPPGTDGAGSL